jgi:hypothetical protein
LYSRLGSAILHCCSRQRSAGQEVACINEGSAHTVARAPRRNRHTASACAFAGRTGEVVDGRTGEVIEVQIFVAMSGSVFGLCRPTLERAVAATGRAET